LQSLSERNDITMTHKDTMSYSLSAAIIFHYSMK